MDTIQISLVRWIIGLGVSLGIGALVTGKLVEWLRAPIEREVAEREKPLDIKRERLTIDNWLVGLIERPFFTVLVASEVSGTAVAILGWIALKMVFDWGVISWKEGDRLVRSYLFTALIGNLSSMFFALIGGLICS
jgi:hypothetical protein